MELSIEGACVLSATWDSSCEGLLAQLLTTFMSFEGDANGPMNLAGTLVSGDEGPLPNACKCLQFTLTLFTPWELREIPGFLPLLSPALADAVKLCISLPCVQLQAPHPHRSGAPVLLDGP